MKAFYIRKASVVRDNRNRFSGVTRDSAGKGAFHQKVTNLNEPLQPYKDNLAFFFFRVSFV